MTSSSPIVLAAGQITTSDAIIVELIDTEDMPQIVMVRWPARATPVQPVAYADTASKIMKVFAQANVRLTQIRSRTR